MPADFTRFQVRNYEILNFPVAQLLLLATRQLLFHENVVVVRLTLRRAFQFVATVGLRIRPKRLQSNNPNVVLIFFYQQRQYAVVDSTWSKCCWPR